jgi:AcrR family transcriptional regulator
MGSVNRNDRRRARTRELLLEAADRLYQEKGVGATTVRDVTSEADVAHGSFYNYFKSMDEVAEALAEEAVQRVGAEIRQILEPTRSIELLPCIGARLTLRMLLKDPAICWMIERPHVFVAALSKISKPFQREMEAEAVGSGLLKPVAGHQAWLDSYPWLLLAQLIPALEEGDSCEREDAFALISMRFLGIPDERAPELLKESRRLVDGRLKLRLTTNACAGAAPHGRTEDKL